MNLDHLSLTLPTQVHEQILSAQVHEQILSAVSKSVTHRQPHKSYQAVQLETISYQSMNKAVSEFLTDETIPSNSFSDSVNKATIKNKQKPYSLSDDKQWIYLLKLCSTWSTIVCDIYGFKNLFSSNETDSDTSSLSQNQR